MGRIIYYAKKTFHLTYFTQQMILRFNHFVVYIKSPFLLLLSDIPINALDYHIVYLTYFLDTGLL